MDNRGLQTNRQKKNKVTVNDNGRNPTVANNRFAQLPGSVSSLSLGFIIYDLSIFSTPRPDLV